MFHTAIKTPNTTLKMQCNDKDCRCSVVKQHGEYLTGYINTQNTRATNLSGNINLVLKHADEQFSPMYLTTVENPHTTVVTVPFTAKVKLTSIIFKSTFKEVRVFPNEVSRNSWKQRREYEAFTFSGTRCLFECFLKSKKFRDAGSVCFVMIGTDTANIIDYVGFKGQFMCAFNRPVIAKYETIATHTTVKEETYRVIN